MQAVGLLAASPEHRPGGEMRTSPNPVRDSMSVELGNVIHYGRGAGGVCTEVVNVPPRNGVAKIDDKKSCTSRMHIFIRLCLFREFHVYLQLF